MLALAAFRISSEARQEGNYLADGKSNGFLAGIVLDLELPSKTLGSTSLRLSGTRDVFPRNQLSAWRVALAVSPGLW
jgi:hypothetical protein